MKHKDYPQQPISSLALYEHSTNWRNCLIVPMIDREGSLRVAILDSALSLICEEYVSPILDIEKAISKGRELINNDYRVTIGFLVDGCDEEEADRIRQIYGSAGVGSDDPIVGCLTVNTQEWARN